MVVDWLERSDCNQESKGLILAQGSRDLECPSLIVPPAPSMFCHMIASISELCNRTSIKYSHVEYYRYIYVQLKFNFVQFKSQNIQVIDFLNKQHEAEDP